MVLCVQNGMIESGEAVPFRLTRNLRFFLTPFAVEGVLLSTMAAAAQAIMGPSVRSRHVFTGSTTLSACVLAVTLIVL